MTTGFSSSGTWKCALENSNRPQHGTRCSKQCASCKIWYPPQPKQPRKRKKT